MLLYNFLFLPQIKQRKKEKYHLSTFCLVTFFTCSGKVLAIQRIYSTYYSVHTLNIVISFLPLNQLLEFLPSSLSLFLGPHHLVQQESREIS